MPTAIVIDGAYFLRRFKNRYPDLDPSDPRDVVIAVMWLAGHHIGVRYGMNMSEHLTVGDSGPVCDTSWAESSNLFRIFFYDCPPLAKRLQLPISGRSIDLGRTEIARARTAIHEQLRDVRKVALRLGRLNDKVGWRVKPDVTKRWIREGFAIAPIDEDFEIDTVQKGVDMRLGLDVASMALKRQVDQIVLVAGDGDFVPAIKLARREGIDVVLDPMGGTPAKDLIANVDGVRDIPRKQIL